MIPVLQSRWRLEGNRLVYYGLRNAPNTLRRKVTVTPSEARAIAALDGSVPLKELPDGGKALELYRLFRPDLPPLCRQRLRHSRPGVQRRRAVPHLPD